MADTERKGILGRGKNMHVGSEVQVRAECPGHDKLGAVAGQREGAGRVSESPSQHTWNPHQQCRLYSS